MRYVRKAVAATLLGAAAAIGTALLDGDLTRPEAVAAVGAGILAGAGTWAVPNARRQ